MDDGTAAAATGIGSGPPAPPPLATPWQRLSWVMCDWANSGYGLIVITAVFPPFFIRQLLPLLPDDPIKHGLVFGSVVMPASAVVGLINSLSMALMALAAPVLGAIADIKGWTKRLLILSTTLGSALAMAMFFLGEGRWAWGVALFVGSNVCFGTSFAFYNAFLPKLAPPEQQGRLSGWGFAAGYVGGAIALILALLLIQYDARLVTLGLALSGLWWLVFSLPAFFLLPEFAPQAMPGDRGPLVLAGFRRIGHTFRNLKQYRMLFLFLLAFLLYNDGVETVISMSGAYGSDVLAMDEQQLIVMLLIVQFVAFGGAVAFGYLADRVGNKTVIVCNLLVWILAACLAFFISTPGQFMLLGVLVGLVLGGVQASSRALMALLAPARIHNEAFGFFSISGKFASIFGPLMFSGLATAFGARWGILSVLPFLLGGLVVLRWVREPRPGPKAPATSAGLTPAG